MTADLISAELSPDADRTGFFQVGLTMAWSSRDNRVRTIFSASVFAVAVFHFIAPRAVTFQQILILAPAFWLLTQQRPAEKTRLWIAIALLIPTVCAVVTIRPFLPNRFVRDVDDIVQPDVLFGIMLAGATITLVRTTLLKR